MNHTAQSFHLCFVFENNNICGATDFACAIVPTESLFIFKDLILCGLHIEVHQYIYIYIKCAFFHQSRELFVFVCMVVFD